MTGRAARAVAGGAGAVAMLGSAAPDSAAAGGSIPGAIFTTSTLLGAIIGARSGSRTIYRAQAQETN